MKKLFSTLLSAGVILSIPAMAQFMDRGGFNDPATIVNTVAEVKQMPDDSYVVLEGKIEKRIGDEKYLFSDNSGSIKIEIDDDKWQGLHVGPQDKVEIIGKLDKEWFSKEIDVKQIKLVK